MMMIEQTLAPHANISQASHRGKICLTKPMIDELLQGDDLRFLAGLLHTEMSVDEIRAERLKKHGY
jgi:hypothetical protein